VSGIGAKTVSDAGGLRKMALNGRRGRRNFWSFTVVERRQKKRPGPSTEGPGLFQQSLSGVDESGELTYAFNFQGLAGSKGNPSYTYTQLEQPIAESSLADAQFLGGGRKTDLIHLLGQ